MWLFRWVEGGKKKKNAAVAMSMFFAIFCVFLLIFSVSGQHVWALMYSTDPAHNSGTVILISFAVCLGIVSILMLVSLTRTSGRSILCCLLLLLLLWHVHLLICLASLVMHILDLDERTYTVLKRLLPLLAVQGLWLFYMCMVWYYWKELTLATDVYEYVRMLHMDDVKAKAMRADQRNRLGEIPKRYRTQMAPQLTGISMADGR